MQTPLQITFRGMDPSEAVADRIRERVERLEQFFDRVIGCRVTVEAPHHHHRKGRIYAVRVDVHVPGAELVVDHAHHERHDHEDVYVALRDAFDAAERQLEDHARRRRGAVKRHELPADGGVVGVLPAEGHSAEPADGSRPRR